MYKNLYTVRKSIKTNYMDIIIFPSVCFFIIVFKASDALSILKTVEYILGFIFLSSTIFVILRSCSPSARTNIKRYSFCSFIAFLSYLEPAIENNNFEILKLKYKKRVVAASEFTH